MKKHSSSDSCTGVNPDQSEEAPIIKVTKPKSGTGVSTNILVISPKNIRLDGGKFDRNKVSPDDSQQSSSDSLSNHALSDQNSSGGEDDIIVGPTSEEQKQEDELINKKRRKKAINKYGRLLINVNQCHYPVVRTVSKMYKIKTTTQDDEDWDIFWSDGAIQCDRLYRMKPYQRVNHFPGMNILSRKNLFARNMLRMQKKFPDEYDFFPQTWLLPSEYADFRKQFENLSKNKKKTFIVKPEASCQGKGIFLTRNIEDLNPYDHFVVQRYLHKPFLIDELKFDLRIYVLVSGVDPLRVFIYKEGLCRLSTVKYQAPTAGNLNNLYMHLTNYAINKSHKNYEKNGGDDIGHKRSLTYTMKYIQDLGHDSTKVMNDIQETIVKSLLTVQPQLAHTYRSCQPDDVENSMCFEILGFDIFLDENLKPWIIEVNHAPSFVCDTPLDTKIKRGLLIDVFNILNLSIAKKQKYKREKAIEFQKRALKGKKRITVEERQKLKEKKNKKREKYEQNNAGGFQLIYPVKNQALMENYDRYLEGSIQVTHEHQGTTKKLSNNLIEQQTMSTVATSSQVSTGRGIPHTSSDQIRKKGVQTTIESNPRRSIQGHTQNFMKQTRSSQRQGLQKEEKVSHTMVAQHQDDSDIIFFPVNKNSSNTHNNGSRRLVFNSVYNNTQKSESKQKYYSFVRPISASNTTIEPPQKVYQFLEPQIKPIVAEPLEMKQEKLVTITQFKFTEQKPKSNKPSRPPSGRIKIQLDPDGQKKVKGNFFQSGSVSNTNQKPNIQKTIHVSLGGSMPFPEPIRQLRRDSSGSQSQKFISKQYMVPSAKVYQRQSQGPTDRSAFEQFLHQFQKDREAKAQSKTASKDVNKIRLDVLLYKQEQ